MAVTIDMLFNQLGTLTTIFQAIGGLIVAYIVFAIMNMISQRRKERELEKMRKLLEQISKKLDKKR
jgi:signal transduction histidine kinase